VRPEALNRWRWRAGAVALGAMATASAVIVLSTAIADGPPATVTPPTVTTTAPAPERPSQPAPSLPVPAALVDAGLGLREGPTPVPLELRIPSIAVGAPVLGVGMTPTNVMDAPMGSPHDPVWNQAFWYRGSAIPGAPSTALLAGHVDDPLGQSAVFGRLDEMQAGDEIVVRDTRSGLEVRFAVTEPVTYTLAQASDPTVLNRIYGSGPVAAKWPQPSSDGLAHLTLITCAGTFRGETHDHRLVVYATRVP